MLMLQRLSRHVYNIAFRYPSLLVFDNFNCLTFPARRKRLLVIRNTIRRAVITAGTRFCPVPSTRALIRNGWLGRVDGCRLITL